MLLKEVANAEGVSLSYMQTVVNVLKDTDATNWRGWSLHKEGKYWVGKKQGIVEQPSATLQMNNVVDEQDDDELTPLERAKRARQNARPVTTLL